MKGKFDGNVVIRHVYREANACANRLAKYEHSLPLGVVFFERVPPCISLDYVWIGGTKWNGMKGSGIINDSIVWMQILWNKMEQFGINSIVSHYVMSFNSPSSPPPNLGGMG